MNHTTQNFYKDDKLSRGPDHEPEAVARSKRSVAFATPKDKQFQTCGGPEAAGITQDMTDYLTEGASTSACVDTSAYKGGTYAA